VLTTSRRPLGIGAEAVVELSPLEPGLALRLLRLRTLGHRPRLDLGADPEGLAELCRLVDGLPLAIELAALRLRTMSLRALLRRVGRQHGLLAGSNGARLPHQRALDTTLQWSYDLLTRPGRLLLRRLALFEGCFTIEEAERASGHDPLTQQEVAGLLSALVEQCMVQTERGGESYRYRLLTPVRRFVLDLPKPVAAPVHGAGGHRRALTAVCANGSAV
jgi:predicted ATPase